MIYSLILSFLVPLTSVYALESYVKKPTVYSLTFDHKDNNYTVETKLAVSVTEKKDSLQSDCVPFLNNKIVESLTGCTNNPPASACGLSNSPENIKYTGIKRQELITAVRDQNGFLICSIDKRKALKDFTRIAVTAPGKTCDSNYYSKKQFLSIEAPDTKLHTDENSHTTLTSTCENSTVRFLDGFDGQFKGPLDLTLPADFKCTYDGNSSNYILLSLLKYPDQDGSSHNIKIESGYIFGNAKGLFCPQSGSLGNCCGPSSKDKLYTLKLWRTDPYVYNGEDNTQSMTYRLNTSTDGNDELTKFQLHITADYGGNIYEADLVDPSLIFGAVNTDSNSYSTITATISCAIGNTGCYTPKTVPTTTGATINTTPRTTTTSAYK